MQNIFLVRALFSPHTFLCARFPFLEDEAALTYAHAFCLPAFDASSLNELLLDPTQLASFSQQLGIAKDNIQELRGYCRHQAMRR